VQKTPHPLTVSIPSWCGPCKILGPILEKVTKDGVLTSGSGKPFDLVTIDTGEQKIASSPIFVHPPTLPQEEQIELAMKYGVRRVPGFSHASWFSQFHYPGPGASDSHSFRDGKQVAEFVGAIPEPKVREFLKSV
jgi:thioredoxin 1